MRAIERRIRALGRVGRQRAGDQRRLEQRVSASNRPHERVGGRELRAVEQRQPFLRRQRRSARGRRRQAPRRPAGTRSPHDAPRRRRSSPPPCARAAPDRRRRRPSPAPARPAIKSRASMASSMATRLGPHARGALRQARRASAPSSAARSARRGSPTPAACDSTMLRCSVREVGGRDAHAREFAEAGVDAVDRLAPGDDARRPPRRCAATAGRGAGSSATARAALDGAPVGERSRRRLAA